MKIKSIWHENIPTATGVAVIVLFSIFAMIIVAGILAKNNWEFMVSRGHINQPPKKSRQAPAVQPSLALPRTNIGDWIIYENEEYKFSLAHPPQAHVTRHMVGNGNSVDGFLIHDGKYMEQSVWIMKTDCSPQCFQEEIVGWWPKTRLAGKETVVGGRKAYEISFDDGEGKVRKEVYIRSDNGTVVYFVFPDIGSKSDLLSPEQEKILDSFRFD